MLWQSPCETMSATMTREKRGFESIGGDAMAPETKRQKVPALASIIVEALKVDSLQKLCSLLEPALRRVVSEEVGRVIEKLGPDNLNGRSFSRRIHGPGVRNLRLHFKSTLSLPLFTGSKVEGEHGSAIHVILLDAHTGHVITTGPESSAKLDVVVLEGDFSREDDEDWTAEDFENHIVREREGKGPLLTGDLQVTLRNGVGTLGDLTFTDNSSWIRSRKFRLGLKPALGFSDSSRIREAKTEAFAVKDHRGELYKKHYPPAPQDEVWRLEKVGKDGSFHRRLNQAGIFTVEDFLRYVVRDPQKLRNILGSGMSNKMWDSLAEHAKTCVLSGKLYIYYSDDSRAVGAAFNSIYEFCGLVVGQQYYPTESLSESQKAFADVLMKKAHDNWSAVVEYEGKALPSTKQATSTPFSPDYFAYDQHLSHPSAQALSSTEPSLFDVGLGLEGAYDEERMGSYPILGIVSGGGEFGPAFTSEAHANVQLPNSSLVAPSSDFEFFEEVLPSGLYAEDELRMKGCKMPEEDMRDLLRGFNMGDRTPVDSAEEYACLWPALNQGIAPKEPQSRSPGKAVSGWLKIKAAMKWGIFVRKKAAKRRAQLVELVH